MLEVKNLTKTYRSKSGQEVRALDDVSIRFPERGMVIILGKSGSGKSTLLNVIGGLDRFDGGELLIEGRSSRDLNGSDFDSYRNTMIGFIFQEYNILEDFTVGANIGLALELQGKRATSESVGEILRRVDLEGYGTRKPNELSGGQLQRVAIARALVKEPKIIMADEPTGALDSATGKTIFETLRRLSEEKLVIIVSHDREFAERYADRIIELSDGKVVSDVSRKTVRGEEVSDGIRRVGESILHIRPGYRLTEEDLEKINRFLAERTGDAFLSGDERVNDGILHTFRMNGDGDAALFDQTVEEKPPVSEKQTPWIRSSLPLKDAVRIGASGLRRKRFRLVMTVLLSVVAFTLFGISDTMAAFNQYTASTRSIMDEKIGYASFVPFERSEREFNGEKNVTYREVDLHRYEKDLADRAGLAIYPVCEVEAPVDFSYMMKDISKSEGDLIRRSAAVGFVSMDESALAAFGADVIAGNCPKSEGEVMITKQLFDLLKVTGLQDNPGGDVAPGELTYEGKNGLLGRTLPDMLAPIDGYRIVGILDTHLDISRYEKLNDADNSYTISDILLADELQNVMDYGLHALLFVADGIPQKLSCDSGLRGGFGQKMTLNLSLLNEEGEQIFINRYTDETYLSDLSVVYPDGRVKGTLADDECLVPDVVLAKLLGYESMDAFLAENSVGALVDQMKTLTFRAEQDEYRFVETDGYGEMIGKDDIDLGTDPFEKTVHDITAQISGLSALRPVGYYKTPAGTDVGSAVLISGKFSESYGVWSGESESSDLYRLMKRGPIRCSFALAPMPIDRAGIDHLVQMHYEEESPLVFRMQNPVMSAMDSFLGLIEVCVSAFVWIGVFFAVFAALLLSNFISVSISYKKREIGILRAVGARSVDVYKIFFSESAIIACTNFAIASVTTALAVGGINRSALLENSNITLMSFGIRQVLLLFAVSMLVAALASFFPVFCIARKKPIDAIRDR